LALTTPAPDANDTIAVGGATMTGNVNVVNTTASVVITGTKLASQSVVVGGAASGNVVVTGTATAPIYTVDTSSVAATGGSEVFTLTVSEAGKSNIVYTVTVVVAGVTAVNLGTAQNYAILAESGISSGASSAITGDIAISPAAASFITGFGLALNGTYSTSALVTGNVYASDYTPPTPANLTTAVGDMGTAYTDAAGRTPNYTELYSGDISGRTLTSGVYKWSTGVQINTDVTLSGGANDVFIFEIAGGITQASSTHVNLTGGVQAKNVFWQSASTVAIGTGAQFEGNVLGMTNITMGTGASITGRLLAQTAVTLGANCTVIAAN